MPGRVMNTIARVDINNGGTYQITGRVMDGASPAQYRVQLFDQVSGLLLKETWSSITGDYAFTWIANKPSGYAIICFNHADSKAAILGYQTPSAM